MFDAGEEGEGEEGCAGEGVVDCGAEALIQVNSIHSIQSS
jgi:hypothetical protein